MFNLLFKVAVVGVSYFNRRPIEYLVGRNDLFQKRYQRFLRVFKYSPSIPILYVLLYIY